MWEDEEICILRRDCFPDGGVLIRLGVRCLFLFFDRVSDVREFVKFVMREYYHCGISG